MFSVGSRNQGVVPCGPVALLYRSNPGFALYLRKHAAEYLADHPEIPRHSRETGRQVVAGLAAEWKDMTKEERAPYMVVLACNETDAKLKLLMELRKRNKEFNVYCQTRRSRHLEHHRAVRLLNEANYPKKVHQGIFNVFATFKCKQLNISGRDISAGKVPAIIQSHWERRTEEEVRFCEERAREVVAERRLKTKEFMEKHGKNEAILAALQTLKEWREYKDERVPTESLEDLEASLVENQAVVRQRLVKLQAARKEGGRCQKSHNVFVRRKIPFFLADMMADRKSAEAELLQRESAAKQRLEEALATLASSYTLQEAALQACIQQDARYRLLTAAKSCVYP